MIRLCDLMTRRVDRVARRANHSRQNRSRVSARARRLAGRSRLPRVFESWSRFLESAARAMAFSCRPSSGRATCQFSVMIVRTAPIAILQFHMSYLPASASPSVFYRTPLTSIHPQFCRDHSAISMHSLRPVLWREDGRTSANSDLDPGELSVARLSLKVDRVTGHRSLASSQAPRVRPWAAPWHHLPPR